MPYKVTDQGTMEFSGKIVEWMKDFQKWYTQDCGSESKIEFLTYIQYATMIYGSLAKGKWQDGFFTKSKARTLDSYLKTDKNGNIILDTYLTLDFLAENLNSDDRNQWSQQCRNQVKKFLNI